VKGGVRKACQDQLRPLWKKFLLNQFHDVIPGSCIKQVIQDALDIYSGEDLVLPFVIALLSLLCVYRSERKSWRYLSHMFWRSATTG